MPTIQSGSIIITNPPLFTPTSVHVSSGSIHFEKSPTDSKKDANHKTKELIRDLCMCKNIQQFILAPGSSIIFPNEKKFTNKGTEPLIFHETNLCQKNMQQPLKA